MKLIDEKNYESAMKTEIEPYLVNIRRDEYLDSFDGNQLHFEAYEHENAKAAVLVLHGFTESAEKFREVSYYFFREGYSVFEMLHAFERACGRELPSKVAPRRPGDIAECYADAEKARRVLGWSAKLGIDDMCQSSWNWHSKNPDGYANDEE